MKVIIILFIHILFIENALSFCSIDCENSPQHCGGYCDEDSKQCVSGRVCQYSTPICKWGYCVQCERDSDCLSRGYSRCDTFNNVCVQCKSSFDCRFDPFLTKCDTYTHTCVQCNFDYDCTEGGRLCGAHCSGHRCSRGTDCRAQGQLCKDNEWCVNCLGNSDCPSSKPFCESGDGECYECFRDKDCRTDSNCNAVCNGNGLTCTTGGLNCLATPDTPKCNLDQGRCVFCYVDSDCTDPEKPKCSQVDGKCHECASHAHCRSNQDCTAQCQKVPITVGNTTLPGNFQCVSGNPLVQCNSTQPCDVSNGICSPSSGNIVLVSSNLVLLLLLVTIFV